MISALWLTLFIDTPTADLFLIMILSISELKWNFTPRSIARLNKEYEKLETALIKVEGKLKNPKFRMKAPKQVLEKEKAKLAEIETALSETRKQLNRISS